MTTDEQIEAMTVIGNIQAMRRKIGVGEVDVDWLLKNRTLKELREEQEGLIEHYNQAIQNKK